MKIFTWLYILINLFTIMLYAYDKRQAKRTSPRISERTLLYAGLLAAPGAFLGMYLLRHKTRHARFRILIPLACLVHLTVWVLCQSQP